MKSYTFLTINTDRSAAQRSCATRGCVNGFVKCVPNRVNGLVNARLVQSAKSLKSHVYQSKTT